MKQGLCWGAVAALLASRTAATPLPWLRVAPLASSFPAAASRRDVACEVAHWLLAPGDDGVPERGLWAAAARGMLMTYLDEDGRCRIPSSAATREFSTRCFSPHHWVWSHHEGFDVNPCSEDRWSVDFRPLEKETYPWKDEGALCGIVFVIGEGFFSPTETLSSRQDRELLRQAISRQRDEHQPQHIVLLLVLDLANPRVLALVEQLAPGHAPPRAADVLGDLWLAAAAPFQARGEGPDLDGDFDAFAQTLERWLAGQLRCEIPQRCVFVAFRCEQGLVRDPLSSRWLCEQLNTAGGQGWQGVEHRALYAEARQRELNEQERILYLLNEKRDTWAQIDQLERAAGDFIDAMEKLWDGRKRQCAKQEELWKAALGSL